MRTDGRLLDRHEDHRHAPPRSGHAFEMAANRTGILKGWFLPAGDPDEAFSTDLFRYTREQAQKASWWRIEGVARGWLLAIDQQPAELAVNRTF
jgi:hypothetical protein